MTNTPKPERKRWRVPTPKPRAPLPAPTAPPVVSEEADRIAYAQWLVECGMEKSAAAKTAASRDIVSVRRLLGTLRALAEMNGARTQ